MNIASADIKTLREKTGAGMMDCKKALSDAAGDYKKAERLLKERGIVAAETRQGRATNEGRVAFAIRDTRASLVELSCETDFVARNENFIGLAQDIADLVASGESDESAINEKVLETASVIKENMTVKRAHMLDIDANEFVSGYIHGTEGGVGCIVKLRCEPKEVMDDEELRSFSHDAALHLAAFRPKFLDPESVPENYIQEQREIFHSQAQKLDKPEKVLQGIVEGKLKKHFKELCFTEQPFVKDEKQSLRAVLAAIAKRLNADLRVSGYLVFSVGTDT